MRIAANRVPEGVDGAWTRVIGARASGEIVALKRTRVRRPRTADRPRPPRACSRGQGLTVVPCWLLPLEFPLPLWPSLPIPLPGGGGSKLDAGRLMQPGTLPFTSPAAVTMPPRTLSKPSTRVSFAGMPFADTVIAVPSPLRTWTEISPPGCGEVTVSRRGQPSRTGTTTARTPIAFSVVLAELIAEASCTATETVPSGFCVTAYAAPALPPNSTKPMVTAAVTMPAPAVSQAGRAARWRRRRAGAAAGVSSDRAWSAAPCSRIRSSYNWSANLVNALTPRLVSRLPEPGPGAHQPHARRARRQAERGRRLPGRQAGQVHQLDQRAVGLGQRGQPGDQRAARSFGVDAVEQLPDLVRFQLPATGEARHPFVLPAARFAVACVDAPGYAEQPGTPAAPGRVEGPEGGDGLYEGVRGQVGDGLRVGAAPGEVRGDRVHLRPVEPLELRCRVTPAGAPRGVPGVRRLLR